MVEGRSPIPALVLPVGASQEGIGPASGRDLLVGRSGLDKLSSNSDLSTIYIGGNLATADRNNVDSLRAIMSEWNSAEIYT